MKSTVTTRQLRCIAVVLSCVFTTLPSMRAHSIEDPRVTIHRVKDQAKAHAKYAGRRIEQDVHNFFRWIREGKCDRVGRKEGPDAKTQCDAEVAANKSAVVTPHGDKYKYYAAMEVDCSSPRKEDDIWGTVTIRNWSTVSQAEAKVAVQRIVSGGKVCAREWHNDELTDGEPRLASE